MRKIHDKHYTYGPSQTKPGQSLIPAELLKRHLAGTLPDIQKVPEFTHDEYGKQIGENLNNLELHELHDLGVRLRAEYAKREQELSEENEKKKREAIIAEHQKNLLETAPAKPHAEPPRSAGADTKTTG